MKIGKDPTKEWICVETKRGKFQFHETEDKLVIHVYSLDPRFDKCTEVGKDCFSGAVFAARGSEEFYLVLFVTTEWIDGVINAKFLLVHLSGEGNAYGISSPLVCSWSKAHPNDPLCTEDEILEIIKDRKLERVDMRCSAVPGQCGWNRCHIEDCTGLPNHVTYSGEVVKSKRSS